MKKNQTKKKQLSKETIIAKWENIKQKHKKKIKRKKKHNINKYDLHLEGNTINDASHKYV